MFIAAYKGEGEEERTRNGERRGNFGNKLKYRKTYFHSFIFLLFPPRITRKQKTDVASSILYLKIYFFPSIFIDFITIYSIFEDLLRGSRISFPLAEGVWTPYTPVPMCDCTDAGQKRRGGAESSAGAESSSPLMVPRATAFPIKWASMQLRDLVHLPHFADYERLVEFVLCGLLVYGVTEGYFCLRRPCELNFSLIWYLLHFASFAILYKKSFFLISHYFSLLLYIFLVICFI